MPPPSDAVALLRESGLFDASHYLAGNPDVAAAGLDPAQHFHGTGWREGRTPNPYFDTSWYGADQDEVDEAGDPGDPLLHYLCHGEASGRRPCPEFDPAWYRAAQRLPASHNALADFLARRHGGIVSPNPEFEAAWYRATYPDVAGFGDPFEHYRAQGRSEARLPRPPAAIIGASGLFDASYYLLCGPDLRHADLDPLSHYCATGWQEGRKPNLYFDPVWYAAEAGVPTAMDPLLHYLLLGEAAGRAPSRWFAPSWYAEAHAVPPGRSPLAHFLAHRRSQRVSPNPDFDLAAYLARHVARLGPGRDPFADFLRHGGGADRFDFGF